MTTDITELAQILKAAAEKAIAEEGSTWWNEEQLASDYGLALHRTDAKFIALASHENVLALVEALVHDNSKSWNELYQQVEAKDKRNAELVEALEKAQAQSSKWLEAYHKAVSIGARYEERIAELESRTVKLPTTRLWAGVTECYEKSDVIAAIRAAGVEVSDD
ncbi:hypothetical protein [Klebsiella michiganensis]|uniref:hypothetical protein n=1 Tax=Klebsiella michiganensis TaxID=1134687 RepID=UPI0027BBB141|nr:hypothetical protein [Klebsiella michiganensis]MDQ2144749.1 hypothetical protein [Klebsiella michiganensis]MDV6972729.1 hypothetical protein [Klebsiella michiganensis]MDW5481908.1 hypothetical protein [Klebsiella michiganensis]MDW5496259.1 hypothetical protein [Klebsiella michiganensis]MDZ5710016.1 hypothetical protein [Klebsiella michiganensis]